MKIDGQCHRGGVHYIATADPGTASIRHCTDCRANSGTQVQGTSAMPWINDLADVPMSPARD